MDSQHLTRLVLFWQVVWFCLLAQKWFEGFEVLGAQGKTLASKESSCKENLQMKVITAEGQFGEYCFFFLLLGCPFKASVINKQNYIFSSIPQMLLLTLINP